MLRHAQETHACNRPFLREFTAYLPDNEAAAVVIVIAARLASQFSRRSG
jgi:hypothetical protein